MRSVVTGCAGFIGSHLAEKLLSLGHEVIGIDSFTDYYNPRIKEANVQGLLACDRFQLMREDILTLDLGRLGTEIQYVFHLAAQPGVIPSWGTYFETYCRNNILGTQRLLEWARRLPLRMFVFASSSSVYGDCETPMREDSVASPLSPYGVSKLACEKLCYTYWKSFAVPVVSLRYFTVYGPRQRPDMAFHKFIKAILQGEEIIIYGNGNQTRDFTYVDDVVKCTTLAIEKCYPGETFNVGGGSYIALNEVVKLLEEILKRKARIKYRESVEGEMLATWADIGKAGRLLGYQPAVSLREGISREVEWVKKVAIDEEI